MTQFEWQDRGMIFEMPEAFRSQIMDFDLATATDEYHSSPIGGIYNSEIAKNMSTWRDIDSGSKLYRGLMPVAKATDDAMAESYFQGWLARNTNSMLYVARNVDSLYDEDIYTGTILDIGQNAREELEYGLSLTGWNLVDQGSGANVGDDITDLLVNGAPEGFNPIDALDVMEARDPAQFRSFLQTFGSKEELANIVKDVVTPLGFFYALSNARHMITISQSLAYYDKTAGTIEKSADWVKTLVVNGIINDPDLMATTGISLATSKVGGLFFGAAKILGGAVKAGKRMTTVRRSLLNLSRLTFNAQRYFPETIGPTLFQKYLWKEGYKRAGFWGKAFRNIPGNIAEGTLTGFMAEVSNQTRRVDLRFQKEWDWGAIGRGTLEEAVISIAVNPIMGRVYQAGSLAGIGVGHGIAALPSWSPIRFTRQGAAKYGAVVKAFKKHRGAVLRFRDPEYASAYIDLWALSEETAELLDEHLTPGERAASFGDVHESGRMGSVLQLDYLMGEFGIPQEQRIRLLKESLQRLKEAGIPEGGRSPEDLMYLVAEDLAANVASVQEARRTPAGQRAVQNTMNSLFYLQNLASYAEENNMTIEEAQNDMDKRENYYEVLVDAETRAEVEESWTEEERAKLEKATEKRKDELRWERAQKLREKQKTEEEKHVKDKATEVRQENENLSDAVDAASATTDADTPVINIPPSAATPSETSNTSNANTSAARDYAAAHEETHKNTTEELRKAEEARDTAAGQAVVNPTPENQQAAQEAQKTVDNLEQKAEAQGDALTNLKEAIKRAEEVTALLDTRIKHLTQDEIGRIKKINEELKSLSVEARKKRFLFIKKFKHIITKRNDGQKLTQKIIKLKNLQRTRKKSSLEEKESKNLMVWLAQLKRVAEDTGNKTLIKAVKDLEKAKTLSDVNLGKVEDAVIDWAESERLSLLEGTDTEAKAYQEHKKLTDRIEELTNELKVIKAVAFSRAARIKIRRFDRMASARNIAKHQAQVKRILQRRLDAFEAEASKRRERAKDDEVWFTRQELFELTGKEEIGAWVSPLSETYQEYFRTKKGLQGKKKSAFLKHKMNVTEARKILTDSASEVRERISKQHPGIIISDAFNKKRKSGQDITNLDEEYLPSPDLAPEERLALSTPGLDLSNGAFYLDGVEVKGIVDLQADGISTIVAFETADISTAIHELGHIARRHVLDEADLNVVENWLGVEGGRWSVEHEETFARGFERYIREGRAPEGAGDSLTSLFSKLKSWLVDIYQSITGSEIDVQISDEVRAVFDKLVQRGKIKAKYSAKSEYGKQLQEALTLTDGETVAVLALMDAMKLDPKTIRWERGTARHKAMLQKKRSEGIDIADLLMQGKDIPVFLPKASLWKADVTRKPLTDELKDFTEGSVTGTTWVFHGTIAESNQLSDVFDTQMDQLGLHLSANPYVADMFTMSFMPRPNENGRIYPLYMSLKNPLRLRDIDNWHHIQGLANAVEDAGVMSAQEFMLKVQTKLSKSPMYEPAPVKYVQEGYFVRGTPSERKKLLTQVHQEVIQEAGYDGIIYLNRGEILDRAGLFPEKLEEKMNHLQLLDLHRQGADYSKGRNPNYLRSISDKLFKQFFPEAEDSFIVFKPTQVKSALANNGSYSTEYSSILRQTAEPSPQVLVDDAISWASWVEGLEKIETNSSSIQTIGDEKFTEAVRIWGSMPARFREQGRGPHVIFREAILDQEKHGRRLSDSDNYKNEEEGLYNITDVIRIARREHARAVARMRGWHKIARADLLEDLTNELVGSGEKPGDVMNYFVAVEFIKRVEESFRPVYQDLWQAQGFISHLDETTGEPIYQRDPKNLSTFEQLVRRSIRNRLEERARFKSGNPNPAVFDRIYQMLNIIPKDSQYTLEDATEAIIENIAKMTPEDETIPWSIESLGNGTIDLVPATELGAGLVDLLLNIPLATQRGVDSNVLHNEDIRSEDQDPGGESIRVVQARTGESNRIASIPLYHLAEVVNQYRYWKRVKHLLETEEFTPEQQKAVEEWVEKVNLEGTPDPLGFRSGFMLRPHFMGGTLDQAIPNRETIRQWTTAYMYRMPNLAISTIYDQISVTQDNPLRFRGDLNNFSEDFSHGDDIILPFHWWGEVLAYEQMSPRLEGLSGALLKHEAARYAEWRSKNPDLSLSDLFSIQTHSDRTGSGIWEMKALSLAADPNAINNLVEELKKTKGAKTIAKEIEENGLFETILKYRGFTKKEVSDHYLNLALETGILISENIDDPKVQSLGGLINAFASLSGISTVEEMQASEDPIVAALRDIFKTPAMRHVYSGALNNFRKEFILARKGKAVEAINKLGELLGIDFYAGNKSELEALGVIIYSIGVNNMSIALQEASLGKNWKPGQVSLVERGTGISDSMKLAVMRYLSLNQSADGNATLIKKMAENWALAISAKALKQSRDAMAVEQGSVQGTRKDGETGIEEAVTVSATGTPKSDVASKDNRIIRAAELLKLYEANLQKAAIIDFGEQYDFEEALEKTKNRYTNWPEIEAFLKERRDRTLSADELAQLKELSGVPVPQTEMAVFRGLNMLGSSAHRLNQERAELLAEAMNIAGFDADEQLTPFGDHNLFFPVGYSTMSDRGYQGLLTLATLTGSDLERVAVRPLMIQDENSGQMVQFPYKSFEEYMKAKKDEATARGEEWNPQRTRQLFKHFYENVEGAAESLAAFDMVDSPLHDLSPEEAQKKIDHMITLQQFLWWSNYEAPPKSVFPDYTIEDSDADLLRGLQSEWMEHSERMYKELPLEMKTEVEDSSPAELKLKGKSGLLRSPEASRMSGYPVQLYHRNEVDSTRYVETGRRKGFMSTAPLYQSLPFFDKGILSFQRKALDLKIKELLGAVDPLVDIVKAKQDDAETRGWASPWSEKVLPSPTTALVEYLQLFPQNDEGILAAEIAMDIDKWAEKRGMLNELYQNPRFYPYYYILREIEKIHDKFVTYARADLTEEEIIFRRSEWLTAMHSIDEVSRNALNYEHSSLTLEDKASLLALARPIHDKDTWKDVLTSTVSEDAAYGKLLSPTEIHQELKSPLMPIEAVPILRNQREVDEWDELVGSAGWEDIVNSLTIDSGIIQAHDFNRFLIAVIYQDYIHKVLKGYTRANGEKPYADVADRVLKNPIEWESIVDRSDRPNIIEEAKLLARGSAGVSIALDISVAEHIENAGTPEEARMMKLMVERAVRPTTKRGKKGETVSFNSRHAAGELGFGFLVRSPRKYKLIGNKFKIHLTPEAALKIFAITDNIRPLHELQEAFLANKIFGAKFDGDQTPMRADPLQQQIRNAFGFTTRHRNAKAMKVSNALNMIVRQTERDKTKGPLMLSQRKVTLDRFDLDLVDLHAYKTGEAGIPEGMTSAWREAVLSPITEALYEIEENNLSDTFFNLDSELRSLVFRARNSIGRDFEEAMGISIALSAFIRNGSRRVPTDSMILPFLNPNIYNTKRIEGSEKVNVDNLIQHAEDIYRKLVVFQDPDSFIQSLPLYHAARTFVFEQALQSKEESRSLWSDSIEDRFLVHVREKELFGTKTAEEQETTARELYETQTKDLLKSLGLSEEVIKSLPEFTDFNNWITDTNKVISIDIETNLPYVDAAREVVAVGIYNAQTKKSEVISDKKAMTKEEATQVLTRLEQLQNEGYKLVTFNGTGFDLMHLGRLSGNINLAGRIAVRGIDLMTSLMSDFDSTTSTGLSLDAVSTALEIPSKVDKGLYAVLYWKRMNGMKLELSDLATVRKLDDEKLTPERKQEILDEVNKLNREEAKNKLWTYVQDDVVKNHLVFKSLIEKSGTNIRLAKQGYTIANPRPTWLEGINNHKWNRLIRQRFATWGPFGREKIDSVVEQHPTILAQSVHERHLDNYNPGLSMEEKQRQLALLSLRAAVDHQERHENLRFESRQPSIYSEDPESTWLKEALNPAVSRTQQSSLEFADTRNEATRPHLRRILETFNRLESEKTINGKTARLLRQLIFNAHALNPLIVRDLRFDFEKGTFAAGKTEGGGYYIRFGSKLKKIGKDPLDAVQIFAHELAHIARIKFIRNNSGEWKAFQDLLNGRGKGLIKKLVLAWHGNRWDALAQHEYENYTTKGPEEFIAALGQYFLMKDLLPTIQDITGDEAKTLRAAVGIIGRIMNSVHETFSQLGHVWSKFYSENDDITKLMHRLFGLDITSRGYSMIPDVQNPGPVEYGWMNRFEDDNWMGKGGERSSVNEVDQYFGEMVAKRNDLEILEREGSLNEEQLQQLHALTAKTERRLESGLTIHQHYTQLPDVLAKAGVEIKIGETQDEEGATRSVLTTIIDMEKLLNKSESTLAETQIDKLVAYQHGLNHMRWMYGNQIMEHAGEFSMKVAKGIAKLGRAVGIARGASPDENWVRQQMLGGLVGHTGAEYTYGAAHIAPIWITTLIDERITNMQGHYDTIEGLPSLQRSLQSLVNTENLMLRLHSRIQDEILSPVLSRLFGAGVSSSKTNRILKEVGTAFSLIVENPNLISDMEATSGAPWAGDSPILGGLEFSEEALDVFGSLSEEKQKILRDSIIDMAENMRTMLESITKTKQELGEWTTSGEARLGYRLSKEMQDAATSKTMFDKMNARIFDMLRTNPDSMHAGTLVALNILPRVDTEENLREDLFGANGIYGSDLMPSGLFTLLVGQIAKYSSSNFDGKTRQLNAALSTEQQQEVNNFVSSFKARFEDGANISQILAATREAIYTLKRRMNSGDVNWSHFRIREVAELQRKYNTYINEIGMNPLNDMRVDDRLQSLFTNKETIGQEDQMNGSIAFETQPGKTPMREERGLTTGKIYNPIQLSTRNLLNRAYYNYYVPNDAWFVPRISDIVKDPEIRSNLTLHPVRTVSNLKRGLADSTHERMILQHYFGLKGDIGHFLSLFEYASQVGELHTMSGAKATQKMEAAMLHSVKQLREKYAYIRGHQEDGDSFGGVADYAYTLAPAVTKIAFGGNLGIASLTVEHMMNTLATMTEGRFVDGLRTMVAPIFHGLSGEQVKIVAADIADAIEGMTQGFIPDYERTADEAQSVFGEDFLNAWASQVLRFPKHVLRTTSTARVITFRKGVYELVVRSPHKMDALKESLKENPLKEPGDLEKAAKAAKLNWWKYGSTLIYLQRAGLLQPDRFEDLSTMVKMGAIKDKFYLLGDTLNKLSSSLSGFDAQYSNFTDILASLKHAESQYLHENMVQPNAFDVYTGTNRHVRAAEIFRRFPVLWSAQMMIRRSNQMPLIGYGTKLFTMLTLDMVYMMMLRLAAGNSIDDILDEIRQKGWGRFMVAYGARLPLFGRYYGWIAAAIAVMAKDGRGENGFVPGAALINVIKNMTTLGLAPFSDTDKISSQDLINAARIFPYIGDTLVRLAVYGGFGNQLIQRGPRYRAATDSRGIKYAYQHMGVPADADYKSFEAISSTIQGYLGLEPNFPQMEQYLKSFPGIGSQADRDLSEAHIDPEKALGGSMGLPPAGTTEVPQSPYPSLPVDPIQEIESKPILEAPKGLLGQ